MANKYRWQTLRRAKFCVSFQLTDMQFAVLSKTVNVVNKWNCESYKISYILNDRRGQLGKILQVRQLHFLLTHCPSILMKKLRKTRKIPVTDSVYFDLQHSAQTHWRCDNLLGTGTLNLALPAGRDAPIKSVSAVSFVHRNFRYSS